MSETSPPNDPLAFGRQLWQQWNDALQSPGVATPTSMPDWSSALGQWGKLVGSPSGDVGRVADKVGIFGEQFMGLMKELVQRAAGSPASATDLGSLWSRSMADGNPMLDALRQISTDGAKGWEQLFAEPGKQGAPMAKEWLASIQLPGFGLGRERQERMGEFIAAQAAHAEAVQGYQQLLKQASELGMQRFESKLGERSEPGRQIDSMRGLYDVWIDAAEEAYAQVALSPEFRTAYAKLVNTQMRAKQLQQKEVERMAAEAGMPTRSELDGVLKRIHELQRDLRTLRSAVASKSRGGATSARPADDLAAGASKPAARKAATAKRPVKSTAPAVSKTASAKKSAEATAPAARKSPARKPAKSPRRTASAAVTTKRAPLAASGKSASAVKRKPKVSPAVKAKPKTTSAGKAKPAAKTAARRPVTARRR